MNLSHISSFINNVFNSIRLHFASLALSISDLFGISFFDAKLVIICAVLIILAIILGLLIKYRSINKKRVFIPKSYQPEKFSRKLEIENDKFITIEKKQEIEPIESHDEIRFEPEELIDSSIENELLSATADLEKQTIVKINHDNVNEYLSFSKLELGKKTPVFFAQYEKKVDDFMINNNHYLDSLLPVFFYDKLNYSCTLHFLQKQKNEELEELMRLWKEGYRSAQLVPYFLFYLLAIKDSSKFENKRFVFSLLSYTNTSQSEKSLLQFLFQNELQQTASPTFTKAQLLDCSLNTGNIKLSFDIYFTMKTAIGRLEFLEKEKKWLNQIDKTLYLVGLSYYKEALHLNSNRELKHYLYDNYNEIFYSHWQKYIFRQAFRFGRYDRLKLLNDYNENIVLQLICDPEKYDPTSSQLQNLVQFLNKQDFCDFHLFYFFIRYDQNSSMLKSFTIENHESLYNSLLSVNFSRQMRDSLPTGFLRYVLFIFYSYRNQWQKVLTLYDKLGRYTEEFYGEFFYARSLFESKFLRNAWEKILEMLQKYPENLLVLNEAAIYAYRMGELDKAEEIFSEMKRLYPNHPVTIYNEAIFYEERSMQEIKNRWQKYHELIA